MSLTDLTAHYGMPESLRVEARGAVRIVTLNRPESLNSIATELHQALISVWGAIAADAEARAVVITGAGTAFSAGGDFKNFARLLGQPDLVEQEIEDARALVLNLLAFKLPVIAAVNGAAVGLGSALASLSDLVVMSETAYFKDPHVAVGLVAADGGSLTWPFLMSMQRAKEHILLGTKISPQEAKELGLANRVVPPDSLMQTALDLAVRLAALPPQAVQETKRTLNLHLEVLVDSVLDYAIAGEKASFATPEFQGQVERFLGRAER